MMPFSNIISELGVDTRAGNKININSFIGPYLKYFSRDKRIALAPLGQYFLSRENIFTHGPIKELILFYYCHRF